MAYSDPELEAVYERILRKNLKERRLTLAEPKPKIPCPHGKYFYGCILCRADCAVRFKVIAAKKKCPHGKGIKGKCRECFEVYMQNTIWDKQLRRALKAGAKYDSGQFRSPSRGGHPKHMNSTRNKHATAAH